MKTALESLLLLLSPLPFLPGSATAQTVPPLWDRSAEWTDISGLPAGSMQGNPAPDSVGNLVWNFEWAAPPGGPHWAAWTSPMPQMQVDPAWAGGFPSWAAKQDLGAAIFSGSILDVYLSSLVSPAPWKTKPFMRWENTTGQSFSLDIVGELVVAWDGAPNKVSPTDVDVAVVFVDASAASAKTLLYLNTVSKPTPASMQKESLTLPPINILGVSIDPGDSIVLSVAALTKIGSTNYVLLHDSGLRYVVGNSVPATETVRSGVPANPQALMPGLTSGPVAGKQWDPFIDHTTFMPGAVADFLSLSLAPANIVLAPLGTLLCDFSVAPLLIVSGAAGAPLAVSIPLDAALFGVSLCAQGAAFDGVDIKLTNALDITIGSH